MTTYGDIMGRVSMWGECPICAYENGKEHMAKLGIPKRMMGNGSRFEPMRLTEKQQQYLDPLKFSTSPTHDGPSSGFCRTRWSGD